MLDIGKLDLSQYLKTPSKQTLDIETFTDNIKYGIWGISYFQKLTIKQIILDKDNQASVIYDGKQYILEFPNIQAKFDIQDNNNKDINLRILNLVFKKIGIQTDGSIVYSTQTRKLGFNLIISPLDAQNDKLYLQGITNLKVLNLKAKTSQIKNIGFLKPYLEKISDADLQAWIFEKIKFSDIRINSADMRVVLNKEDFLPSLIQSAKLEINIKNPQIYLENNLKPITATQAVLKLQKEKIFIALENPVYDNMQLDGSDIVLSNLLESPKLDINIVSKQAFYQPSLRDLLSAYDIELPIDTLQSPANVHLNLSLQFLQNSDPIISVKGLIHTQKTNFSLYKIPLQTQEANISLDITPEYKYVYIRTQNTKYQNIANMDTDITLDLDKKNLQAHTTIHKLQINTNNDINTQPYKESSKPISQTTQNENTLKNSKDKNPTKTSQEELKPSNQPSTEQGYQTTPSIPIQKSPHEVIKRKIIDALKAQVKNKFTKDIFYATSDNLPTLDFSVDFSNPDFISLVIPEFQIQAIIQNNLYTIKADNLNKFYPYSPLMQYLAIKNGDITADTHDFENINFSIHLSNLNLPIYEKNAQKLTEISLTGTANKDGISAYSTDKNILLATKEDQQQITFKNLDFNLDEFLKSDIPAIKEMLADSNQAKFTYSQIEEETRFINEKRRYERLHNIAPVMSNIEANNMTITYKNYQIPLDTINFRLRDGRIGVDGTYKNGVLNLDIIHNNIFVRANNFSGDFVNKILKKNIIRGGLYTLIGAYKDDVFNGELKLQNTLFKDFAILQNLINLIDTIPSLIVFKNPNLGIDGYEIQKGSILFAINSKYIGFEHINLIGSSMDINGNGIVELGSDEINMNLTISTIKNLSNILNKIPIVGYLILGDEGKISTNVIVNGTLENPKTQITLAQDAIKAPFNILRRVFTPIDIIVDEIKKEMK
ncbi:AsmA-like C-terminal domain-containing protein [Helicobacter sp. 11S03491-1]|uniref:YhdP family protein n=1 Tax=Helicobacter sp. 11S03491-1 TaxID=1476196 RepID=UPI0015DA8884|nr:AsmA-like C-terminal domain-containing protein [Helicobacter sp. 11S03491-1]